MKKLTLALATAAVAFVAAAPAAQATYKVIKWDSGMCQVWDNSTQWNAGPGGYHNASRNYITLGSAIGKHDRLVAKGRCW